MRLCMGMGFGRIWLCRSVCVYVSGGGGGGGYYDIFNI